jgi:tetratricopeptide (TPR) repeat protein
MVSFFQGQEREAHIQQAAMAYEKAIELAPTNPFYRVSLAALFIKAGELEKAIAPLEQALHLEPNFVTAQVLLIDVKEKLGYKDEAAALRAKLEETLRRVSGLRPINEYEARLLMDPARYFKDQG